MEKELCSTCHENPIVYKRTKECKPCRRARAPKCVSCKKRPVDIKKRQLCITCYQRDKHLAAFRGVEAEIGKIRCNTTVVRHENDSKILFIKNYFSHKNLIFHPATFHMGDEKYQPDFYDGERNCFIEVAGTRQAYHLNKEKYVLFRKTYPQINFEIRTSDGRLLDESEGRLQWSVVSNQQEADPLRCGFPHCPRCGKAHLNLAGGENHDPL